MLESQLSPAGAFICSAVNAGAGVIAVLAASDLDEAAAPPTTTSKKHSKTSESRRIQAPS